MKVPLYQLDAFTSRQFHGNPAAVCPLEFWLPAHTMQAIAAENNLAETAFITREGDRYGIRWFTPEVEIDLCGHATLASAYVLYHHLGYTADRIAFDSRSGELVVTRQSDNRFALNFPSIPAERTDPHPRLIEGLGTQPLEILASKFYLVVYPSQDDLATLQPNFDVLKVVGRHVIVTARGREADFVSRFFAPDAGIPEDPVTGSAHCTLTPYWAQRLNKKTLYARQISARGGDLYVEDLGDRVIIAGDVTPYLEGSITIAEGA